MLTPFSLLLLSFLTLPLFFSSVLCIPISTFDLTLEQECVAANGGCDLSNPNIWLDHTVPSNAQVFIEGSGNYSTPLLIFINSSVMEYSFTLKNAVLEVRGSATQVALQWGMEVSGAAALSITGGTSFTNTNSSASFTLDAPSALVLAPSASFSWQGTSNLLGNLSIAVGSTLSLNNVVYNPTVSNITSLNAATITIPVGADITIDSINTQFLTVSVNASLTTSGYSVNQLDVQTGSQLTVLGSDVFLNASTTTGPGTINAVNAYVELGSGTLNTTLKLIGRTTLVATSVKATNLYVGLGPEDIVTVIGDGLQLAGNHTAYGSFIAVNKGITISNSLTMFGVNQTLTVNQSSSVTVAEYGTLTILQGSSLVFTNNASIHLGGLLSTQETIEITASNSLNVVSGNGTIHGNLINHGLLSLSSNHPLSILGNFSQTEEGIIAAELSSTTVPSLVVLNASVLLNGKLQFNIDQEPYKKSVSYPVIQAIDSVINGTFIGSATALPGSVITRTLSIDYNYNSNTIYVVYGFKTNDVPQWVWIVFFIIVGVILIATIAICYKCTRRHEYEPIR